MNKKNCLKPTFIGVSRYLKSITNSDLPIKVRREKLVDLDGSCEKKDNFFLVKINKELTENVAIDVLIHEMAHVDSWDMNADVHGRNWGLSYSRLYRLFLQKYFDN